MGFHGVKVKSILQLCKYFSFFLLCTSPWPSCREVEGGGWIAIADSHTVAVVSVPASPWYGSPSMLADAAWGLRVCAFHGSIVWHQFCQHIQAKEGGLFGFHPFNGHTSPWPSCREVEGGGWFAIADSRIVAVCPFPASPWYGSPSTVADAAWASCGLLMARWCGIGAASTFR